jgi:hypothetical protein
VYVLNAPYGTAVDLSATSRADVALTVTGPAGDVELDADEHVRGEESGSVTIRDDGPYFVVAGLDGAGDLTVEASEPLAPFHDPDDGAPLAPGRTVTAMMDYPGDEDAFLLRLEAGQEVELTVDTVNISPDVVVERAGADGGEELPLDSRYGGPLGLTLTGSFDPPEAGDYVIRVRDADGAETGGYLVTLR